MNRIPKIKGKYLYKHFGDERVWQSSGRNVIYNMLEEHIDVTVLIELIINYISSLDVGIVVDALDRFCVWHAAIIIELSKNTARVHYIGYCKSEQETINFCEKRIEMFGVMTRENIFIGNANNPCYSLPFVNVGDYISQYISKNNWKRIRDYNCIYPDRFIMSKLVQGKVIRINPYVIQQGHGVCKIIIELKYNNDQWHILSPSAIQKKRYTCVSCSRINQIKNLYCSKCNDYMPFYRDLFN